MHPCRRHSLAGLEGVIRCVVQPTRRRARRQLTGRAILALLDVWRLRCMHCVASRPLPLLLPALRPLRRTVGVYAAWPCWHALCSRLPSALCARQQGQQRRRLSVQACSGAEGHQLGRSDLHQEMPKARMTWLPACYCKDGHARNRKLHCSRTSRAARAPCAHFSSACCGRRRSSSSTSRSVDAASRCADPGPPSEPGSAAPAGAEAAARATKASPSGSTCSVRGAGHAAPGPRRS